MANPGGTQHGGAAAQAAPAKGGASRPLAGANPVALAKKPSGYGLPCSNCHLYYPADLDCCPTCHTSERVSPIAPKLPPKIAQKPAAAVPATNAVEQEREEFLKQFKAQLRDAHAEASHPPGTECRFKEQHAGDSAAVEICGACYERLQERVDALEGALHIDLKEAAQIVYDAVWANPSEASKTYENAAKALLDELRKRAGIGKARGASSP